MNNKNIHKNNIYRNAGHSGVQLVLYDYTYLENWASAVAERPWWRIYYNSEEGAKVSNGGKAVCLAPDAVLAIPPYTPVEQKFIKPHHTLYLHAFMGEPFDSVKGELFCFRRDEVLLPVARELMKKMSGSRREKADAFFMACALVDLVASRIPEKCWPVRTDDSRILEAEEALVRDLPDAPSNEELAAAAHMSLNSFIRLFKLETGLPPQAYLMRKKLELACVLLDTTGMTIEAIADACGFMTATICAGCSRANIPSPPRNSASVFLIPPRRRGAIYSLAHSFRMVEWRVDEKAYVRICAVVPRQCQHRLHRCLNIACGTPTHLLFG